MRKSSHTTVFVGNLNGVVELTPIGFLLLETGSKDQNIFDVSCTFTIYYWYFCKCRWLI